MTYQSSASIHTTDSTRIVKRLCNHWKHKFEITEQDQKFTIPFPDANVVLEATSTDILILIRTKQQNGLQQYENVVLDHLNRMAQQEFSVNWQRTTA